MNEFLPLTEPLLPNHARRAFEEALLHRGIQPEDLDPETDIIIDTFRNEQGETLHRYRVRTARLKRP